MVNNKNKYLTENVKSLVSVCKCSGWVAAGCAVDWFSNQIPRTAPVTRSPGRRRRGNINYKTTKGVKKIITNTIFGEGLSAKPAKILAKIQASMNVFADTFPNFYIVKITAKFHWHLKISNAARPVPREQGCHLHFSLSIWHGSSSQLSRSDHGRAQSVMGTQYCIHLEVFSCWWNIIRENRILTTFVEQY